MTTLIGAVLVRNEAAMDRHLRPVMARLQTLCDRIVVLDDRSTDETVEICKGFGATVRVRDQHAPAAWGNEAVARQELWDFAVQNTQGVSDWVLFCDADMVLHGDPRPLLATRELNSWAFPLYDLWNVTQYRAGGFWRGHEFPRIWLVAPRRVPDGWVPTWEREHLHVGHLPTNWPAIPGIAPSDLYYLHYAYATPKARAAKAKQYLAREHLLTPHEAAHARSILDETP